MRNLIDMTIDVEPLRYGTFDVRIVELGKHYECDLYIDNGEVECLTDIPTRDDKEDEAIQKRIIAAALEEYPGQIEGFNRFVNIDCDGDYEYAIKTLFNRNGLVASGSLSNYNKRVKRNIEASPKDMFTYEGIKKKYGKRYILNEMKSSNNRKWDVEVFTTYNGIQYILEYIPNEGWSVAIDGHDMGRRWETRPNIEKMLSGKIKRIDRYQWSNNDVDDFHEVEYPDRDKNFIGGVGKGRR